jgi:hypothetical protein
MKTEGSPLDIAPDEYELSSVAAAAIDLSSVNLDDEG